MLQEETLQISECCGGAGANKMFLSKTCNCLFLCLFRPLVDCVKRGFPRLVEFSLCRVNVPSNKCSACGFTNAPEDQTVYGQFVTPLAQRASLPNHPNAHYVGRKAHSIIAFYGRRLRFCGPPSFRGGFHTTPLQFLPPPSSRPGCLGPAWRRKRPDGWTSTTQGKPESDC